MVCGPTGGGNGAGDLDVSQSGPDLTRHIITELLGVDEEFGPVVSTDFQIAPALDRKLQGDDSEGGNFSEMVGAQEVGQFTEFRIVEDEEKGIDLIVLEIEDLQDRFGIGPVEFLQIVDFSGVFQTLGEEIGGSLGP